MKAKILVTGCAGFIGSNLCDKLLEREYIVIGVDNFNDYYDPKIKEGNISQAQKNPNFKLYREDILDFDKLDEIFKKEGIDVVVHLAARAGVRPSIKEPKLYAQVNVLGTVNLLKLSARYKVEKFIFGSSSSVYGNSKRLPFSEDDPCDQIISPYGASKRAAEFFVEAFHNSYDLNCVILRFFTVYGARGRPDMAPSIFAKAIMQGSEINQFGDGSSSRDYTYIDDIVDGIISVLDKKLDFEIINLGNNSPVILKKFINTLEAISAKKTKIKSLPSQAGDVSQTWANISKAENTLKWKPKTSIEKGLSLYYTWLQQNLK